MILKKMRQDMGYSQKHVASSLSIPVRTYQSWETCYTSNVDNLITICSFYDITPVELFTEWLNEAHPDNRMKDYGQEIEGASIIDSLLRGADLEELIGAYPKVFLKQGETPDEILYRLILDAYFTRPDTLIGRFPGYCQELESRIAETYSLPEESVIVVKTDHLCCQLLKEMYLSFPGSSLLIDWAADKPGFRLGVSNGYTVARILDQVGRGKISNLSLFPLNFTNTSVDYPISSNSLISSYLYKTEGYGSTMDTPGEMEVYGAMLLADAVILGAGTFSQKGLYESMIQSTLGSRVMESIREAGVIGDLNYNLLDKDGKQVILPEVVTAIGHPEQNSLIKAISLDLMAQKADRGCRILAAAAGAHKALSIHLALKNRYVNHLLIDQSLANELMKIQAEE